MAVKKPLIRYEDTGKVEELRVSDTVTGASGGGSETFAVFSAG